MQGSNIEGADRCLADFLLNEVDVFQLLPRRCGRVRVAGSRGHSRCLRTETLQLDVNRMSRTGLMCILNECGISLLSKLMNTCHSIWSRSLSQLVESPSERVYRRASRAEMTPGLANNSQRDKNRPKPSETVDFGADIYLDAGGVKLQSIQFSGCNSKAIHLTTSWRRGPQIRLLII